MLARWTREKVKLMEYNYIILAIARQTQLHNRNARDENSKLNPDEVPFR